jgi:hypothetical protein
MIHHESLTALLGFEREELEIELRTLWGVRNPGANKTS